MKKTLKFLRNHAEDIFIGSGLVVINVATFKLSTIAGLYTVGATLLVVGVVLARFHPPQRR